MLDDHQLDDCRAAMEDWEASLCTYEVEVARWLARGPLRPTDGAPDPAAVQRLTERRAEEERALRRFLDACRCP